MHGCGSGSAPVVNAEVDSMGGVVDSGVGIGLKTSPRRAAIEKAQAELRQEYDVREERRRELEFLEKGGNPLDFKFGNAASVSVQSTSHSDQHPEQYLASEAKGSFALTASPHGDSVESSGRPGVLTASEPNTADNLLLFDCDNELPERERSSRFSGKRSSITSPELGCQNNKETEESAILRPYSRRYRSKSNREIARPTSTDAVHSRGGQGSSHRKVSFPSRTGTRDSKGSISEANSIPGENLQSASNSKTVTSNGDVVSKNLISEDQLDVELDGAQVSKMNIEAANGGPPGSKIENESSKSSGQTNQSLDVMTAQQVLTDMVPGGPALVGEGGLLAPEVVEQPPCVAVERIENHTSSPQLNGFSEIKGESKMSDGGVVANKPVGTKGLDSESSCTRTSLGLDVHNDLDLPTNSENGESNEKAEEQTLVFGQRRTLEGNEAIREKSDTQATDSAATIDENDTYADKNQPNNVAIIKDEAQRYASGSDLQHEVKHTSNIDRDQYNDQIGSVSDVNEANCLGNDSIQKEALPAVRPLEQLDSSCYDRPESALAGREIAAVSDGEARPVGDLKLLDKAREDSILEEARIIEAKRKRIAELSLQTSSLEIRKKSQWDFVVEEMSWLANDFAQERIWKITAAGQLCRGSAHAYRSRYQQESQFRKLREVAHTLAKAVMQFWRSANVFVINDDTTNCKDDSTRFWREDANEVSQEKRGECVMEERKKLEMISQRNCSPLALQAYAVRFLKYNPISPQNAEAPKTLDWTLESSTVEMPWKDHVTEESLFYTIPSTAMDTYRKSIEALVLQFEKTGSSIQEEVETSMHDAPGEFGHQEIAYDDEDAEMSTYSLPGVFDGSKSSRYVQKKRKNSMKLHTGRHYEAGADFHYGHYSTGNQHSTLMGKRPANLNVGPIPTKRVRTASRQRVIIPFSTGAAGGVQSQLKTDASSGDTNSFQDDQSTLRGGSQNQKSIEVESVGIFEKQLRYDSAETPGKSKKRKKAKHLGSSFDHRWPLDFTVGNDQRDNSRKRLENYHFDGNGTSGMYGHHNDKKQKTSKELPDNNCAIVNPMIGSIPSPVASQMSNMSNPNKFFKFIGGRDRGRKSKSAKISAGQSGSGSRWSHFEDQAVVVLVHDMGPNWELVGDAFNGIFQFKSIYRKATECKERYRFLMENRGMENSACDGADSAEDSGSSQPYSYPLPGIPQGGARQLFQRLHEPIEEDALKCHFEKIIKMGQKQRCLKNQTDNQDPKKIVPAHPSHAVALSQVCPNNLNGVVLTPLDLCDAAASSPDVHSFGYQSPQASGFALSNQGATSSMLPNSGANSSLQGSSAVVVGSNLTSASSPLTASRDGRYSVPRPSLAADDQQRMHHYSQMLAGRNIQQPNFSVRGNLPGTELGVRMLQGGNGMGMMSGINRSMPMSRPGFQGMASSAMLTTGSMLSSSMVGMPNPTNVSATSSGPPGQGNSIFRSRESLHMMRPGHNPENQRKIMVPEVQMQVSQGTSQGIPAFNGFSSAFPSQTTPPSPQTYPVHSQTQHQMSPQQSHVLSGPHQHLQSPNAMGSQQQAYAVRFAKERQLHQQRYLQQQQQQFAASNAVQPQSQLPMSSSLQNSPQIQSQSSSQQVSLSPLTPSSPMTSVSSQHQQKHHLPPQGLSQNATAVGLTNQVRKQRQRQPQQQQFQQAGRQHPQQQQQPHSQQQAKLLKGVGRNMVAHQNISIDPSHLNGLSVPPGNQAVEKGEKIMHLTEGQSLYSMPGINSVQPSKPFVPQSPNRSQIQQKLLSGSMPPSKQVQAMPSHSENSHIAPISSGHSVINSQQASNHQHQQVQPQPPQKQVNQAHGSIQRALQQNCQANSDMPKKAPSDLALAEKQLVNNTSHAGMSVAMPQTSIDSTNAVPVIPSAVSSQWNLSEPGCVANNLNAQVGSIRSSPLTNLVVSESLPINQGVSPRQLSSGLPSQGPIIDSQWPHQAVPQHQPPNRPPPTQQQEKQQECQSPQPILPVQQQSQQQLQHLK